MPCSWENGAIWNFKITHDMLTELLTLGRNIRTSPVELVVKNPPANAGDARASVCACLFPGTEQAEVPTVRGALSSAREGRERRG